MIIAVDFDGTCTAHDFPQIGHEIGAAPVLKKLTDAGHQLILYTMRSDVGQVDTSDSPELHGTPGNYLTDAINWFRRHNIPLYAVQKNPTQSKWTKSPKCYAHMYIDDNALGTPLKYDKSISSRPFVDWAAAEQLLIQKGIL